MALAVGLQSSTIFCTAGSLKYLSKQSHSEVKFQKRIQWGTGSQSLTRCSARNNEPESIEGMTSKWRAYAKQREKKVRINKVVDPDPVIPIDDTATGRGRQDGSQSEAPSTSSSGTRSSSTAPARRSSTPWSPSPPPDSTSASSSGSSQLSQAEQLGTQIGVQLQQLLGAGPNGALVQSLAQSALKGFSKAAEEAAEVWLNLPPPPLTDTVPPSELADPDSKFVRVNGVDVHYKEVGEGGGADKPTLVLLHGFSGSEFSWRLVMKSLSEAVAGGCRVIAFDRPPFGLTSRPLEVEGRGSSNPYTNPGSAKLMLALMDALGVRSAVLVGHSAGAAVAVEAALQAPARVTGLVLDAPGVFVRGSFFQKSSFSMQLRYLYTLAVLNVPGAGLNYVRAQYRRRKEALLQGRSFGYHNDDLVTDEILENYTRPMKAIDWDKGALLQSKFFAFDAIGDRIQALKAPVLIVQGRQDRAIPEESARRLKAQLEEVTSVQYHVLEDCGHLPQEEHPEEFATIVSPFLQQVFG